MQFTYHIFDLQISVWSVLSIWGYFFTVISISPHVGTETLIFMKVGKRLMKLFLAYASIVFGFFFAFAILLPHNDVYNHMIIRVNTIMTMMMGEVDLDVLKSEPRPNASAHARHNPFEKNFWEETNFSANIIFLIFCCSVSVVVFNILTAFAIKVSIIYTFLSCLYIK